MTSGASVWIGVTIRASSACAIHTRVLGSALRKVLRLDVPTLLGIVDEVYA